LPPQVLTAALRRIQFRVSADFRRAGLT
jgi:hypothetical protein